jgi:DNA-binding NtrC family response regulator/pSer/pThr/pTyr-binding forkhead associated (FHA) protein
MGSDPKTLSLKPAAAGGSGGGSSSPPGRLRLLVIAGDGSKSLLLPEHASLSIGRGADVDLRLDDHAVSRRHLLLHLLGDHVRVEDLGSANGTRVRGRDLGRGETVDLLPGDAVEIGRTVLVLQRAPSSQTRRVRLHAHDDFVARVDEECGRAVRAGSHFSVVRLSAGGQSAATADEKLAGAIQPGDVLGEYGPGEYEVLLVDCSGAVAEARARRLAASISSGPKLGKLGMASFPADGRTSAILLEKANAAHRGIAPPHDTETPLLGRDGAMEQLRQIVVERIAPSMINVLLLGETGVGKGVLAAEIHRHSTRASGPFVALNCVEIPESLLEAELFGHERGVFTGAVGAKSGLIDAADGGTLFLDEVGEMPLSFQAKLLVVLGDLQVRRLGSAKSHPVDIRIVAATNVDLEERVESGRFRRDLYFRLNGITLTVPSLKDRTGELEGLVHLFLQKTATQTGRPVPEMSPEGWAALRRYSWPGNVRELRNVIERAAVLCKTGVITADLLPAEKPQRTFYAQAPAPLGERERIEETLLRCGGNQTRAAKELGISRRTLVSRLAKYKLPRPRRP